MRACVCVSERVHEYIKERFFRYSCAKKINNHIL